MRAIIGLVSCVILLGTASVSAEAPAPRTKASFDNLKALLLNSGQTDRARIRAAGLLGDLDDPRAESLLLEALSDPKEAIRFGVARALGRRGRAGAVEPLLKHLNTPEESRLVRSTAAQSLGAIGDPRAVPTLIATRQDAAADVRVAARQALLAFPSAVVPLSRQDLLVEILTDGDAPESARAGAARRLGGGTDVRGIGLLIAALEAPVPPERTAATVVDLLHSRLAANASLPATAARALGRLGAKEAVPALVQAARKADGEVRIAALEALARLRAPSGIPVAVDGLGDREPRVRRWAAFLLAELDASGAVPQLCSALRDSDDGVRLYATRALVRVGDAGAVDTLVEALAQERIPQVRSALQDALLALAPVSPW